MHESLMKRIHAFEQWCYQRMLKISRKDKVSNTDVLKRIREKEPRFYGEWAKQYDRNSLIISSCHHLTTLAQLHSGHFRLLNTYKARITTSVRCLSGVWSGTTLRRTSVQLLKPSDTTHSARRPTGQPGFSYKLPKESKTLIYIAHQCWRSPQSALYIIQCSVFNKEYVINALTHKIAQQANNS